MVRVEVHDELILERIGACVRHFGRRRLGRCRREQRAIDLVHHQEGSRHAAGALKEAPPADPLPHRQFIGQLSEPRLHARLRGRLGARQIFIARNVLRRNRARKGVGCRRQQLIEVFRGQ
jgi:hypothetical protein